MWFHALIGATSVTVLILTLGGALGMSNAELFAENAAHELLQSLTLGFAFVAGLAAAVRRSGLSRYAASVVSLISLVGFFREMPSCRGDIVHFCASSDSRGLFMAAAVVALLVVTSTFELRSRGSIIQAIHPRLSWPLALVAVSVGASQLSEDLHMEIVEEALELYAYLVLMLSVVWLFRSPLQNRKQT